MRRNTRSGLGRCGVRLLALLWLAVTSAAQERPNIVLAIADDLDPDHLGFCGNALARTPNLDRLAADGLVFPTLYVQPVCRPALATLLSGRWPHQTGILHNLERDALDPAGALPLLLRERGYATFCGGKFWEGDIHAFGFTDPETNDLLFARKNKESQDELFHFLERRAGQGPWFVWWAPSLPHVPHRPPVRFARAFEEAPVTVPPYFRGKAEEYLADERASLAMEAWLDAEFSHLVAKLEELGQLERTIFVFLADNGWSTGLPSKGTPFEKGVRSPLVLSVPGHALAGRRVEALIDLVDVHATLLDYAGVPPRADAVGHSLRPWIEGRGAPQRERLFGAAYARDGEGAPNQLVYALYARDARWKYVLFVQDKDSRMLTAGGKVAAPFRCRRGQQSLFDLTQDPFELRDLAGQEDQAERLRDWRERTLTWWRETGGGELELTPETPR